MGKKYKMLKYIYTWHPESEFHKCVISVLNPTDDVLVRLKTGIVLRGFYYSRSFKNIKKWYAYLTNGIVLVPEDNPVIEWCILPKERK